MTWWRRPSVPGPAGAHEIDVVLPYTALLAGDEDHAAAVLDRVREATGDGVVKVIIESGELPDQAAVRTAAVVRDRARG